MYNVSHLCNFYIAVIYGLLLKNGTDEAIALGEALCHLKVPSRVVNELEDIAELYVDHEELSFDFDITVSKLLFTATGRHALKVSLYRARCYTLRAMKSSGRFSQSYGSVILCGIDSFVHNISSTEA